MPTALAAAGLSVTTGSYVAAGTIARLKATAIAAVVIIVAAFRVMSTLAIVA